MTPEVRVKKKKKKKSLKYVVFDLCSCIESDPKQKQQITTILKSNMPRLKADRLIGFVD